MKEKKQEMEKLLKNDTYPYLDKQIEDAVQRDTRECPLCKGRGFLFSDDDVEQLIEDVRWMQREDDFMGLGENE